MTFDFVLQQHGSICLLEPQTKEAYEWLDANIPEDDEHLRFGVSAVIEPRYVEEIVIGIQNDGLDVE